MEEEEEREGGSRGAGLVLPPPLQHRPEKISRGLKECSCSLPPLPSPPAGGCRGEAAALGLPKGAGGLPREPPVPPNVLGVSLSLPKGKGSQHGTSTPKHLEPPAAPPVLSAPLSAPRAPVATSLFALANGEDIFQTLRGFRAVLPSQETTSLRTAVGCTLCFQGAPSGCRLS